MKRIVGAIALLACMVVPAAADGYYNNRNNQFQNWEHNRQYYKHHKHRKNNNNYNGWELGGAFVGGLIIGNMLDDQPNGYYVPPPAYADPYPQTYRPAPRWAGPRYCESMLYYDAWGNLVQSRDCYR